MIVTFLLLQFVCYCETANLTREETLRELFRNYDSTIPPTFNDDEPVKALVQLYILGIDSVSDSAMEYTLFMILRQKWYDKRLQYNRIPGVRALELDPKAMNSVWVPDLYMVNEKRAKIHDITTPNKLLHIYSDDGYSTDRLMLRWNNVPVELAANMSLPQFILDDINTAICDRLYAGIKYTCITVKIHFTRKYGYHLIQEFIPSALIVMLSWVSFWISLEAVPARISIGLLSVLTMTTQSSGSRTKLPEVSYIKAIDIWMSVCMLFVFAALLEYALVNVFDRKQKRRETYVDTNGVGKDGKIDKRHFRCCCLKGRERARIIDKFSRVLFPVTFTIFNMFYWSVYLIWEPVETLQH
ncbi:Glycine receptor subunit alpha-4,Glycine receptor subunit alpha-2 [Mytilus coruscus]|uniref:Glycine receptor subunit alpha-4,Glycine receptor subunit alpha-2 n=1 Tax=Mytilus coruscus TaxID=42192 RepID=A0A6J8C468_MYTCO|nr:Glycine receptor subunit alpha-4,Glycine receptor subunit alpha-2 [Mytilus coruscus]